MPVFRTDRNQVWGSGDQEGVLLSEEVIEVDITAEAVHYDLHDRLRRHLASPKPDTKAWLADLTRLVLGRDGADDLLAENA